MAKKRRLSVRRKNRSGSTPWTPWASDPILQELYAIREKISAECGHDMQKIYEYFRSKRATKQDRGVGRSAGITRKALKNEHDFSKGKRGAVLGVPPGKVQVTIRLDQDVVDWFGETIDATGSGDSQDLMNQALREFMQRSQRPSEPKRAGKAKIPAKIPVWLLQPTEKSREKRNSRAGASVLEALVEERREGR
jgi:uncharacterized protein (DUF4415 family)